MEFLDFTKKNSTVLFLFFFLVLIIYGQSLSGDFVYDDRNIVEYHNVLASPSQILNVAIHPYWEASNGLYRPLTLLSYSANLILFGDSPFSFHLINLALYIFICFFVYLLIKKLFNDSLLAFISALLFLVLPIHTEVVANITGRSELLCLFFGLLALLEFSKEKVNYWLLGLYTLLSIGSKETGIALLPVLAIMLYQKERAINLDILKKYFLNISSALIAALLYLTLRFFSLGINSFLNIKTSLIENPLLFVDPFTRAGTALKILWMYMYKTIWPVNLCSDYSYNQISAIGSWLNIGTILGLLMMLFSVFIILRHINKKNILSLAASIFLFAFLPISNIFFGIGTIAGERLFFYPSLGICLITGFIIWKIFHAIQHNKNKILFLSIITLILALYGLISLNRQTAWLNETNLFISAGKCAPDSVLSRSNLGAVYLLQGSLDKAEQELLVSKNIAPLYSKGLNNLGLVYFKKGDYAKAQELYFESLHLEYPYPGTYENLVLLYLTEGKPDLAKYWIKFTYGLNDEQANNLIESFNKSKK